MLSTVLAQWCNYTANNAHAVTVKAHNVKVVEEFAFYVLLHCIIFDNHPSYDLDLFVET